MLYMITNEPPKRIGHHRGTTRASFVPARARNPVSVALMGVGGGEWHQDLRLTTQSDPARNFYLSEKSDGGLTSATGYRGEHPDGWGRFDVGGFLKAVFGTMLGVELASYDMTYQAARTLDRNRRRLARRLKRIPPHSVEAEELTYHLRQINNELTRFAYYGVVPPNRGGLSTSTLILVFYSIFLALAVLLYAVT